MPRLLIPVHDSPSSYRLLEHFLTKLTWFREPVEIHLLTVQPSLHGDVGMFINAEQIRNFHQEEGLKVLVPFRAQLDAAGVDYEYHIGVGNPAEIIDRYAREKACDEIVMGTSGRGPIATLFMGSVPAQVLQLTSLPVLLIK
jgi:nucleotide-binding universal stress UspA family protein